MATQTNEQDDMPIIRFRDAVGRKFTFPFQMVKDWPGMEELIRSAFLHVDLLGPHVQQGHYDIIGPQGDIILPHIWSALIRPGMNISMAMWPMESGAGQPPMPPGVWPASRARPQRAMRPIVPGPTTTAQEVPTVEQDVPDNLAAVKIDQVRKKPKGEQPTLLAFLAGKPTASKKKSDVKKRIAEPANLPPPMPPGMFPGMPPGMPRPGAPDFVHLAPGGPQRPPPPGWQRPAGVPGRAAQPPGGIPQPPGQPGYPGATRMPPPPPWGNSSDSSESTSTEGSIMARASARSAGLLVNARHQSGERKVPQRQPTMLILEPNPTQVERNEFSSARVYPEEMSSASVAMELTRYNSPPGAATTSSNGERLTWVNASRTIMDFAEFENLALYGGNLTVNPDSRVAMESIFKTIHDKRLTKSRSNWFIQPGTVLRCDVDSGGKTVSSVIFASIPQIQSESFNKSFNIKFRKGVCVPRRLHESFNPYDTSFERDKNQLFRKQDGAAADEILWVCETWVLIVDSVQIFTYGDPRRRQVLQEHMDIREHLPISTTDKAVHVTMPEHVQFQIPFDQCETFFKLQSSVRERLEDASSQFYFEYDEFQLLDADGEPLTARSWSKSTKQVRENLIKIKVEWLNDDEDSSTVTSGSSSTDLVDHDGTSRHSYMGGRSERADGANEFFGIRKISPREVEEADPFVLAELNPEVPPFLGWSILDSRKSTVEASLQTETHTQSDDDLAESVRACLLHTETALLERDHRHIAELHEQFDALDFNPSDVQVGIENIELQIQALSATKTRFFRSQSSGFDDGELSKLYRNYLGGAVRTMEAFAPRNHKSPVLSLYYGALSRVREYLRVKEAVDAPNRWVISRQPIPIPGFKYSNIPLGQVDCHACEDYTIYESSEEAMAHLRSKHLSQSAPESRLREYLLSLSTAADERLKKEYVEILTTSRDVMADFARQTREIQDGVVFSDKFRQPADGVPYALLNAFQLAIAFVCIVPILLAELQTFYKHDVYGDDVENLTLKRDMWEKCRRLKTTGSEISSAMKATERALIASVESRKKEDMVKYFSSTGAHGLAIQMVFNILQEPVYNNMNAAELYRNYVTNFGSQVIRRANKRQITVINAMIDELSRLKEVADWQQKVVQSFRTVLLPETHLEPLRALRQKTYRIEEHIVDEAEEKVQEQLDIITSNIEQGQKLIDMVNESTEIIKDDHSRALFVFTVVTVVFLPLSFVAAYLSMNGGPSNKDWGRTQSLFWQIATPLAVGVGVFCLTVAWQGRETKKWRRWMSDRWDQLRSQVGVRRPRNGEAKEGLETDVEEEEIP